MKYELLNVSPDEIDIPERFREEYGDIEELANSIKERGQLQPIIIDQNNVLIDGHRRLKACGILGCNVLAIRRRSEGVADRKVDELVSNIHRKDFTWQEECNAILEFHEYKKEEEKKKGWGKKWGYRDTAKLLGMSLAKISDAINIAICISAYPDEYGKYDNKSQALKQIQKNKELKVIEGMDIDQIIKKIKASREEAKIDKSKEKKTEIPVYNEGWIYILTNQSLQKDLIKIGKTNRTPEERAKEISSSTGVPTTFNVAFKIKVPDCDMSELIIENELQKYRYSKDREFYELTLEMAIRIVEIIVKHVVAIKEEVKATFH